MTGKNIYLYVQNALLSHFLGFRLCHQLSESYLNHLQGNSINCLSLSGRDGLIQTNENPRSMANFNWGFRQTLELGIGLSCCPSPKEEDLGKIWGRHRSSLLGLFNDLQGIHIKIENIGSSTEATVYIKELDRTMEITGNNYGHVWHLLAEGRYTVTISVAGFEEMTKVVTVVPAAFTDVVFILPYNQARVPKMVMLIMMGTFITIILLFWLYCRCR